jgi:hypothetical protein
MKIDCAVFYFQKSKTEVALAAELKEGTKLSVRLHGESKTVIGYLKYLTVGNQIFPYLEPIKSDEGFIITPIDKCSLAKEA